MKNIEITPFQFIGISVRTTNENGQSMQDITQLWDQFMSKNVLKHIHHKVDKTVYCIYTEYEKDYTRPYTAMIGCRVKSLDKIPTGMVGKVINGGNYMPFVAKGNIMEGCVAEIWNKIWNTPIQRAYTADIEVYNEWAKNPANAMVAVLVAV
jgi:predicted transcriptional regulator YdeE